MPVQNNENVSFKEITELLGDKDFIALQKEISRFSPFDVLRLKSHEIRHSNVLAWLFNPNESHNVNYEFLKLFLFALSQNTDEEELRKKIQKVILDFFNKDNYQISVRREAESKGKKRVDLKIKYSQSKKNGFDFIILIENKIYSTQGKDQLKNYLDYEYKETPDAIIIPVYLTLDDDDEPNDKRYYHMTYFSIVDILEKIILIAEKNNTDIDAINFIKNYKRLLEELLNMNTEKQDLAKEIYRKYKNVIDFISANGDSYLTIAGNLFLEQNKEEGLMPIVDRGNSTFFPFTDSILSSTKGGLKKDWRNGAICGYFFQLFEDSKSDNLNGNLHLKIEIGPFESETIDKREKFLKILDKRNIKYKPGSTGESTYTRIPYKETYKTPISDITDTDEITKKMTELFKKSKDFREKLHECIEEYNKG